MNEQRNMYDSRGFSRVLDTTAAWMLAILWALPLFYAIWTAFHPAEFSTRFSLTAPLTLENFANAWKAAPFARYFVNTIMLVTLTTGMQLVLCTLAAYAFARYDFKGKGIAFALILMQLMIMPDVLVVENYSTMSKIGVLDSTLAISLPYMASAFGIFLLRQTFKSVPKELEEAAIIDGCGPLGTFIRIMVPISYPGIVTATSMALFMSWGDMVFSLTFLNQEKLKTLPLILYKAMGELGVRWEILMAYSTVVVLPIVIVFICLQKYIVSGLTAGSVKG